MKSNLQGAGQDVNRREVLKGLAGAVALHVMPSSPRERTEPPLFPNSPNPRWYGFNLLEYFLTDTDWMKYFPYKDDGQFKEDDFRWIRDWGFNFVRLPMDYRFWTNSSDPMQIDEKKVEPIDRAIRLGEKYGIHVNICLHRAPGECISDIADPAKTGIRVVKETSSVYTNPKTLDAFAHQWSYFAKRYKGTSNAQLSFNLVNEPLKPPQVAPNLNKDGELDVDDLMRIFSASKPDYVRVANAAILAIRQQDSTRLIVSDGYPAGGDVIPGLYKSGVMQSGHDYTPLPLTHYRCPWVPTKTERLPTWPLKNKEGLVVADKEIKRHALQKWSDMAAQGVPIHFAELGCYSQTPPAVAYAWFNDTLDLLREANSGWALWNFRGPFGILDSDRAGTKYQDWHGHQLDKDLLDLLKQKMVKS